MRGTINEPTNHKNNHARQQELRRVFDEGEVMKVSKAKTLVCPFIPISPKSREVVKNISGLLLGNTFCICEGCIAWQPIKEIKRDIGIELIKSDADEPQGYCKRLDTHPQ